MPKRLLAVAACVLSTPLLTTPAGQNVTPVDPPLIPLPRTVEPRGGEGFTVGPKTVIYTQEGSAEAERIGRYLAAVIGIAAGPEPPAVEPLRAGAAPAGILLRLSSSIKEPEGYELVVDAGSATVTAAGPAGLFYGVQTLRQLFPPFLEYEAVRADAKRPLRAPAIKIVDAPRFAWRGAMLDVARHFFTVEEVKRYLDLVALYKINRLHLHLADDQGWRIEIRSWPNLATHGGSTEVGGGPGGYYTQQQYADLV